MTEHQESHKHGDLSNSSFKLMSLSYKIRDLRRPRSRILEEVGIKKGFQVLDFGCGPGSYIIPTVKLIGDSGVLYALDKHPLAVESVKALALKKKLSNVKTILSDCDTGLTDSSIDVVLLYDIFHHFENPIKILTELHRVLKREGILSVSDHHLDEGVIISGITEGGLFKLSKKGKRTYIFSKDKKE